MLSASFCCTAASTRRLPLARRSSSLCLQVRLDTLATAKAMDALTIDTELFIDEVKKYPEIWNPACEEYHDRIKKRGAWFKLCEVFVDGFNDKSEKEKNEIGNKLMKRWKGIKDSFMKSERKKNKSGQGADSGRRYVFARQLSFLMQTKESAATDSSIVEEADNEERDKTSEDCNQQTRNEEVTNDNIPSANRRRLIENTLINFMKQPVAMPCPEVPDDDKLFFDSLIPAVKGIPMDLKLDFRGEVLKLVSRYRSYGNRPVHCNPTMSTQHFDPVTSPFSHGSSNSTSSSYPTTSPYTNISVGLSSGDSMDIFNN